MSRWHLIARPTLTIRDRVRLLFGVPLFVRFTSPDGNCHAACHLSVAVQHEWPDDTDSAAIREQRELDQECARYRMGEIRIFDLSDKALAQLAEQEQRGWPPLVRPLPPPPGPPPPPPNVRMRKP